MEIKDIHHTLTLYEKHSQSIDGNLISAEIAHQKALKLRQIMKGCNIDDPTSLLNPNYEKSLHDWFLDYANENCPSSSITYINVLNIFIEFYYEEQIKANLISSEHTSLIRYFCR